MLQVSFIKQNREEVLKRLAVRNFKQISVVDEVIALDDNRKSLQSEIDDLQSKINTTSKQIGYLIAKKETDEADRIKTEIGDFKTTLEPLSASRDKTLEDLEKLLLIIPNLPHHSVPAGTGAADNVIVREGGQHPKPENTSLPHWNLAKKYDLINFELGNKVTGSGFPFYKGQGAKLQRSLVQYFLDYNTARGYIEYETPLLVNEASAHGTGQLPDKEGQMYFVNEDQLYLIPTSEVPLTNIYRDEIVKENDLPIKLTSYTPCFRREAGSYGKEVRGLNRLHQFDKVEIVQLSHPEKSYEILEEMVIHVEELLLSLELPYRILKLCGGDLGFTAALTYDFEVYSAAQDKWLEVSSVSNFETFQTTRLKARFKNKENKNQLLHSLNGSALALPRIVAALLENDQTTDSIILPKVLHSYFGDGMIRELTSTNPIDDQIIL